jgi:hypothetical protein
MVGIRDFRIKVLSNHIRMARSRIRSFESQLVQSTNKFTS